MHQEMKIALTILSIFLYSSLIAQDSASSFEADKYEFVYSDSANNEFSYGKYEPTSIIKLSGRYFISSILSISFPSEYKTPKSYDSTYFAQSAEFRRKSHISSGSLICLDSNLNMQSEHIFKEQRIIKLIKISETSFYAPGERTDMKKFWVALLNQQGEIKWKFEYNIKNKVTIENATVDNFGNLYILSESKKLPPVRFTKSYGKIRVRFFDDGYFDNGIYFLKINPDGKRVFQKDIASKRRTNYFGRDLLLVEDSINFSYSFTNHFKKHGKRHSEDVFQHVAISCKTGKAKSFKGVKTNYLFNDSGLISASRHSDSIRFYRNHKPLSNIQLPTSEQNLWMLKGERKSDANYILGTLTNNLGTSIVMIDKNYQLLKFWNNGQDRSCNAVDFHISNDNSMLILNEKWDAESPTGKRIIELKKVHNIH